MYSVSTQDMGRVEDYVPDINKFGPWNTKLFAQWFTYQV